MAKKSKPEEEKKETPEEIQKKVQADIDTQLTSLESTSVKKEADEVLNPAQLKTLQRIAYYIGRVGMDLEDSCVLIGVDFKKFKKDMQTFPVIQKVIRIKELEYKKDLLATLSARARNGDDKIAQWLLTGKDPEKYGPQKKGDGVSPTDTLLTEAIKFVQESDNTGLIRKSSGKSSLVKKATEVTRKLSADEVVSQIHSIANKPA